MNNFLANYLFQPLNPFKENVVGYCTLGGKKENKDWYGAKYAGVGRGY